MTVHRAEGGKPAVTVGTPVKIMGVVDLARELAHDLALLARDGVMGHALQDELLTKRRLPQVAARTGPDVSDLSPAEAFALYERQCRHVDTAAMPAHERALVKRLTATQGAGVLLV